MNFIGRVDPVVSPGRVSDHVHTVFGASNFREVLNTPAEQARAECTSATVSADMSHYWAPTLYYIHDNGSFSALEGTPRAYYHITSNNVKPFPRGLRMVSGTAMTRDLTAHRSLGVRLGCWGNRQKILPNAGAGWTWSTCGNGKVELSVTFPSCGRADRALDSPNHFDHMAWPVDSLRRNVINTLQGDSCPPSHPIQYPILDLVYSYSFDAARPWRAGRDNVVLSNGDLHGGSYHADFVSGWDETVLAAAIKDCPAKGPHLDQCSLRNHFIPDRKSYDPRRWPTGTGGQCAHAGQIPAEEVGLAFPITSLPGCNPLWRPGVATKPTCGSQPTIGFVSPNAWKGGSTANVPLYMPTNVGLFNNVRDPINNWRAKFNRWGTMGVNYKNVMMPPHTPPANPYDSFIWLPADTNVQRASTVKNMQDKTAWRGMFPGQ
ncbi:hypothetical protein CC85DRAFT_241950 [Cutaneotrichosporon oleaginosum]|uniref:DUF1996 domain-containing protein n=1 Tax=Cutaneotrichosporon oleaginosum TaxID=879819 RepID=A0A0J0XU74_9TREE|nr:uncharacterized protein CC85DRAFT_241950 [Cutaneotrichosporon oleaginosum]KLT44646.1 hypothetical protein CC85DRAFT_241950 [Cutaneotrichosporon oleaginosum]TXT07633.1 hypothetical protein COLE_04557 [Cutaneotrichosporon oleaginosum]